MPSERSKGEIVKHGGGEVESYYATAYAMAIAIQSMHEHCVSVQGCQNFSAEVAVEIDKK